jgi:hypothetical protein
MAQTLIDNALEQTSLSLSQVAKRITTHGDLILSRWSKKSKDKLRSWLGAANSLPSWLQTSVLIEERMKLISLLYVRTTFSSEHWTAFDAIESGASFNKEKEQPSPFSSAYVMVCGVYFGRVVGFELDAARNRTMLALPHALYIFRKQNELATALLTVVDAIVAEAAPSGNTKWLALTNAGLSGVGGRLDSYQDAGFLPPVNGLDTNALLQAVLDKRDQMVDEVELLQTDPEYTRDHVLALKADIRWDANVSPDIKWEHVASRFATEAISELNVWHDIVLTCEDLRTSCQNYESATTILAGEILHPDNFHMLTVLRQLLYDSQRFQWEELYTAITQMHGMKDLYRMCSAGGKLVPVRKSVRPGAQETPSDRIHKAFCDLATAMNARYTSKSPQFNALLEQLAAVQFDKRAHRCLSTLIQLDALQLCVDWCQTPPPQWQAAGSGTHESFVASQSTSEDFFVEKRHTEIDPSRRDSYEILTSGQPHPKWKPLGPLLRAVCEHPPPKAGQRDALSLAKADEAREHLTVFWQTLRKIMVADRKRQAPTDQRYPALLLDFFSYDVAPEYLAGVEAERAEIEAEDQRSRDAAAASKQAKAAQSEDAQQTTWGEEGSTSNKPAKEKATKPKASGLTSEEELDLLQVGFDNVQLAEPVEAAAAVPAEPAKVHIAVKQDSIAVFRKMFTSEGSTSVRWLHMAQAMVDAGMTMTQNPGSGVKFRYGLRSIVIDKPHPVPEVSARMLRQVQWYYVKGPEAPLRYSFCGSSSRRCCSIVLIWSHKVAGQM